MDSNRETQIIVTLGPATSTEADIRKIKDKGVNFVRINMSHSAISDLEHYIQLAKEIGIPFVIDTEGSQVRTGNLVEDVIHFEENDDITVHKAPIVGNKSDLSLRPGIIIDQLEAGDLIHIDFDTLILRVTDISTATQGYIKCKTITGGYIGKNKAVVIDPVLPRKFDLPPLSDKDLQSIELGLREGIENIAVSFVRSGESVEEVRRVTRNRMQIISKIECVDALENIDDIIDKSDFILIDRGDLSKEIPVEKIPFTQKIIIDKANRHDTGVFVATNLLETMVEKRKPTRAEVHDVISTIADGAMGLTLAAETAIGKHPMECINTLNKLIHHTELTINGNRSKSIFNGFIQTLESSNYLLDQNVTSALVPPHGGRLINRATKKSFPEEYLNALPKITIGPAKQMDVEQIGFGTYSPLEGFMSEAELQSVLCNMRLENGVIWPLPIVLDVSEAVAARISVGDTVGLTTPTGQTLALLHLDEIYRYDKQDMATKLYGTTDDRHPGVRMIEGMAPVLLAGKIDLIQRRQSATRAYELTPKQLRRLFDERGWAKVLGFHTRNVIHRGHEYIQREAMEQENCDGMLIHPVIGKKKPGDFKPEYIIRSYEKMMEQFYPKNKVVFATFSTFSRYAGPKEALFTAICRKNFGCSHFIVGRDHTGVADFYTPDASHKIFDECPDLGINIVKFEEVYFSQSSGRYVHQNGHSMINGTSDRLTMSGTEARVMFESGTPPPGWFMRPEISQIVLEGMENGESVFVEDE